MICIHSHGLEYSKTDRLKTYLKQIKFIKKKKRERKEKEGRRSPQRKKTIVSEAERGFPFRNDVLHGHHHQGQRSRASHPRRRHPRRRCRRLPFPQAIVVGVVPASFRTRGDLFPQLGFSILHRNSFLIPLFFSNSLNLDSVEFVGFGDLLESFSLHLD